MFATEHSTQQAEAPGRCGSDDHQRSTLEPLQRELRKCFSPLRLNYITQVLSGDELRVIGDLRDALIIARIKRMRAERLRRFDRYRPANKREHALYEQAQLQWLKDEQYLLGLRLGRSPSHRELLTDFAQYQNGLRFRAYYALKHPKRMCSINGC